MTRITRNTTTANETAAITPEYVSMTRAREILGNIKASTMGVAIKKHAYLKDAVIRERHPETDAMWTRIRLDAVLKYQAERRVGGGSGSHAGLKKLTVWLSDEEQVEAARLLSEKFGREIEIARLYKGKAATNGVTDEADESDADEDEGSDDGEGEEDA
jgi:hypothetical protein